MTGAIVTEAPSIILSSQNPWWLSSVDMAALQEKIYLVIVFGHGLLVLAGAWVEGVVAILILLVHFYHSAVLLMRGRGH